MEKYAKQQQIMGNRNSYCKTDTDAFYANERRSYEKRTT